MVKRQLVSFREKLHFFIIALFVSFPVLDFVLRNIIPIPIISSLWDELLLAAGLGLVGLQLLSKRRRPDVLAKPIFTLILVGLAYLTLDLTTLSINIEGFRAVFQYVFVFFIAFYLVKDPAQTKMFLGLSVIIGTILAIHGIYQWIVKTPMPAGWVDTTEVVRTRVFSIIGSPNALGSHMAFLIPISLGLLMEDKNRHRKLLWLFAAAAMTVCLVFTGSRGAWLALAGAVGILGIIYDRRILVAAIALGVVAVFFVPSVSNRIIYLFSPEYMMKSAQTGRISRWFDAYDQMRNNPLFGSGLGHYGGAVAKRNFNVTYTDNYYLKTMAEMGLLGLTVFLGVILRTLQKGYQAMKRIQAPGKKFMAAGMLVGLLALVFHNGVENIFEVPYLNAYFWLLAGLLLALPWQAREGDETVD